MRTNLRDEVAEALREADAHFAAPYDDLADAVLAVFRSYLASDEVVERARVAAGQVWNKDNFFPEPPYTLDEARAALASVIGGDGE